MKIKKSSAIFLIASAALVIAVSSLGQNKGTAPASGVLKITAMNPAVANKMAERLPLAPRGQWL
jgi:hypothetical protein